MKFQRDKEIEDDITLLVFELSYLES